MSGVLAVIIGWLAHYGLVHPWTAGVAALVVTAVELAFNGRVTRAKVMTALPLLIMGWSAIVIIALAPRAFTQIVVGLGYAGWRWWRLRPDGHKQSFTELLALLAVVFEAIFLAAAIWRAPTWICLISIWLVAYALVYEALVARGERLARVLAATWALVVVEVSLVFLTWLVIYVLVGSYIIVPQAALILTGLAYCFGGIYVSQRQQSLTRARLAEYLFIALLLVIIVASSTPWHGSL